MPPFGRSIAAIVAAVFVALVVGGLGFASPVFAGPGYESALVAGLVVSFATAIATALEIAAARPEPFDAFCRGVANGAALAAVAFVVTLLQGLRVGLCDALGGSALFALGPGAGALLAGAWGAFAGEIASGRARPSVRRLVAVALAVAGPLASILVSVSRFYTSPMVFAYDPFVGYFSGTLYDTVVDYGGLLSYRAGSAASLFGWFVVALHLAHDSEGRLAFQAIGRPGLLVAGGLSLVASVACIVNGYRLGHWQTPATIASELGAVLEGSRCRVVPARSLPVDDVRRFARECDAHVVAAERWMGTQAPPTITAYLFRDAVQKDALMGAAHTYIAKPWRREVYVQAAGYPHPVLGHEVAHVVAGSIGRGPFRVAGAWGGWLPDPGLIEGLAVAASPDEGELTPREWAKAMKDLGVLPKLSRLFALGFLGVNAGTAYTASGAFVRWVHDTYGADAVRAWYGGRDLAQVVSTSWSDLERAWHGDLDGVTLTEAARVQARRFERPSVFGRRCPHVVDDCKQKADALASMGDFPGAAEQYHHILKLDPGDASTRMALAEVTVRQGHVDEGRRELEAVAADEAQPRYVRDRAVEELGDLALATGDLAAATARYGEVRARVVDEDRLRTLDVKEAAARDATARAAIVALLVGTPERGPDKVQAAALLGAWSVSAPDEGLPEYLLARSDLSSGDFHGAAARLDAALSRRLELGRVETEALRLRVVVACGLGDGATATKMLDAYVARGDASHARREAMRALVARCTAH